MEKLEGGLLFELLYEVPHLSDGVCRHFFRQMIEGLEACHKVGMVRRDLKPESFVLDKNFNVKMIDLGIAAPA